MWRRHPARINATAPTPVRSLALPPIAQFGGRNLGKPEEKLYKRQRFLKGSSMSLSINRLTVIAAVLLCLAMQRHSLAGSATWSENPTSNDWNTADNWAPNTVPNDPSDIASFSTSNLTEVGVSAPTEINEINFNSGADSFTIIAKPGAPLFMSGTGVINTSNRVQTFLSQVDGGLHGALFFQNNATAGQMTSFGGPGGSFSFQDSSSAGSANFDVTTGAFQGSVAFSGSTTAADATINVSDSSYVLFYEFASGGNAVVTLTTSAFLAFENNATADHVVVTCIGGNGIYGNSIVFRDLASAGEGHFTVNGGNTSGEPGSYIIMKGSATAANGSFVINGGIGGGEGSAIFFKGKSLGGTASMSVFGNGELDISRHSARRLTIGSLAGDGLVILGPAALTIGSNDQSTTFGGLIQDSGSLIKTGSGSLTLTGANSYTGSTTVSGGILSAENESGSATGSGAVNVNTGTLGGRGIVAGPTTVGTGSGAGAFLAPAVGSTKQTTLTLQSALTLNADATYSYTFKARTDKARTDLVRANGVTINGATIGLVGQTQGSLQRGLTLTVLSNTSASPINGTFSNLPNGGIVNVNGNNLQASYHGGDGNDLTLTVVR